jgi:hypothetical protein
MAEARETIRDERFGLIAGLALTVLAVAGLTAGLQFFLSVILIFTWFSASPASIPTDAARQLVTGTAVGLGLLLSPSMYRRIRWRAARPFPFSWWSAVGEWAMTLLNFLVLWFVLSLLIRPLVGSLKINAEVAAGLATLLPIGLAIWNAVLYRRNRRQKRIRQAEQELIALGVHCQCGYDLTGNTSGVCPECGTPRVERGNANRTAEQEQE